MALWSGRCQRVMVVLVTVALALGVFSLASSAGAATVARQGAAATTSTGSMILSPDVSAVTCPSPNTCLSSGTLNTSVPRDIVGLVVATGDGGAAWHQQSLQPVDYGIADVDVVCPSVTHCYGFGSSDSEDNAIVEATTDGGATWHQQPVPAGTTTNPVSLSGPAACPSPTTCYWTSYDPDTGEANGWVTTTDGGAQWTWSPSVLDQGTVSSLACPTVETCYVAGTTADNTRNWVKKTTDRGKTFDLVYLSATPVSPAEGPQPLLLSCPAASSCVASGAAVRRTDDGGASWQDLPAVPAEEDFGPLDCPTLQICYALGQGAVGVSVDGARHWSSFAVPVNSGDDLGGISCPLPWECYAAGGSTLVKTTDLGRTWTPEAFPSLVYPWPDTTS